MWALGELPSLSESSTSRLLKFVEMHRRDVKLRVAVLELVGSHAEKSNQMMAALQRLKLSTSSTIRHRTEKYLSELEGA